MPKGLARIVKAALVALTAGVLVAVGNPAPAVGHDVSSAMTSAAQLTANLVDAARFHFFVPASHLT